MAKQSKFMVKKTMAYSFKAYCIIVMYRLHIDKLHPLKPKYESCKQNYLYIWVIKELFDLDPTFYTETGTGWIDEEPW